MAAVPLVLTRVGGVSALTAESIFDDGAVLVSF
jgi:hypothetical protein